MDEQEIKSFKDLYIKFQERCKHLLLRKTITSDIEI